MVMYQVLLLNKLHERDRTTFLSVSLKKFNNSPVMVNTRKWVTRYDTSSFRHFRL